MTFRQLPPAEWGRLIADQIEPYATYGLPDPDHTILLVAESEGRILGVSNLSEMVVNHWHIAPNARRSPSLVSGLWQATKQVLDEKGVTLIHATVDDAQPEVQAMVERLGYIPAEGKLYVMPVVDAVLNER